jgi:uncharacterized protein (TIGR02996 family)
MREAFEGVIRENPYDAETRKVFADWLEENGLDDEAVVQRGWTRAKHEAAEAFMRRYADRLDVGVQDALAAAEKFLETGQLTGTHVAHYIDKEDEPAAEFWDHFVVLTGRPVAADKRTDTPIEGCCQFLSDYEADAEP